MKYWSVSPAFQISQSFSKFFCGLHLCFILFVRFINADAYSCSSFIFTVVSRFIVRLCHSLFIQSIVDRLPGYVELVFLLLFFYKHAAMIIPALAFWCWFFFNTGWKIFIIFCFQFVPCRLSLLFCTLFPFFGLTFSPLHSPFSLLLVWKLYTRSVKGNLETSRWYLWK